MRMVALGTHMSVLENPRQKWGSLYSFHKWGGGFTKDWLHLCYTGPQAMCSYVQHVLDAPQCMERIWLFEELKYRHSHQAAKQALFLTMAKLAH